MAKKSIYSCFYVVLHAITLKKAIKKYNPKEMKNSLLRKKNTYGQKVIGSKIHQIEFQKRFKKSTFYLQINKFIRVYKNKKRDKIKS